MIQEEELRIAANWLTEREIDDRPPPAGISFRDYRGCLINRRYEDLLLVRDANPDEQVMVARVANPDGSGWSVRITPGRVCGYRDDGPDKPIDIRPTFVWPEQERLRLKAKWGG